MYYVYALKSKKNHKRYCGFTSKDVKLRLKEHNSGTNKWTRENGPFDLLYTKEFTTETEARKQEKFLKSGQGRKFLNNYSPVAQLVEQRAV